MQCPIYNANIELFQKEIFSLYKSFYCLVVSILFFYIIIYKYTFFSKLFQNYLCISFFIINYSHYFSVQYVSLNNLSLEGV